MALTAASIVVDFKSNGADKVSGDMRRLGAETDAAGKKSDGFWSNAMSSAAGFVGGGLILRAIDGIKSFGTSAIGAGLNFEQGMANVSAVTGATGAELKSLSDLALKIGKDTTFGATEASQAIEELAKAGVSTQDILNGAADGATALAAAGGVDLPTAATVMASALNQFHLAGDQATHVADLLAAASSVSATGVTELGASLTYVGTTAAALGVPIEDVVTSLAMMADQGLVGSMAGTALNNALMSMANPTAKAQQAMNDLGISFFDASGAMKPMPQILSELSTATAGLTDQQRASYLENIFGVEGARAMNALLASQTDEAKAAGKGWEDYYKAVNQDGAAAQQAAARMDSTMGSIEGLKGSLETLAIVGSMMVLPMFRGLIDGVAGGVDAFTSFITSVQSLIGGGNDPFTAISLAMRGFLTNLFGLDVMNAAMPFVDGFLDVIQTVIGAIQSFAGIAGGVLGAALGFIGDHFGTITGVILPAAAAFFTAMKAISAFQAVASAVGPALAGLKAAFLGLPFPLLAATAAAALLVAAYQTNFMGFADLVNGVASAIGSGISTVVSIFSSLTAVMNPVAAAFGTIGTLLSMLAAAFPSLAGPIGAVAGVFNTLAGVMDSMSGVWSSLTAQMNPVSAAFAFMGVLAAKLGAAFPALASIFGPITAGFTGLAGAAINFGDAIGKALMGDWSGAFGALKTGLSAVGDAFGSFADVIPAAMSGLQGLATKGFDALAKKFPAFSGTLKSLGKVFGSTFGVVKGLGTALSGVLKGDMGQLLSGLSTAGSSMVSAFTNNLKFLGNAVKDTFKAIDWGQVGDVLSTGFTGAIKGIGSAASGAMDWLGDALGKVNWGNVAKGIGDVIGDAFDSVNWGGIGDGITNALQGLGNLAMDGLQAAWDGLGEIDWGAVLGGAVDLASKFADWTINDIPWKSMVTGAVDLAGRFTDWAINDIPWKDLASGAWDIDKAFGDWVVNDIPWKDLASGAIDFETKLGDWVINDIPWGTIFGTTVDLASKFTSWVINDIPWGTIFTTGIDLYAKLWAWTINDIPWTSIFTTGISVYEKLWSWTINDIPWVDIFTTGVDLAGKFTDWAINDIDWVTIVKAPGDLTKKFADWAINDVDWPAIIKGVVDLGNKFGDWAVNDIPWKSILNLPDLSGLSFDIKVPSVDDILQWIFGDEGRGKVAGTVTVPDHSIPNDPEHQAFAPPGSAIFGKSPYDPEPPVVNFSQTGGEAVAGIAAIITSAIAAIPKSTAIAITQTGGEAVAAAAAIANAAISAIPTSWVTSITQVGGEAVAATAAIAHAAIAAIPTSWSTSLSISGGDSVISVANSVASAIAAIPSSKTVTISTVSVGTPKAAGGFVNGALTRLAELGPELVAMPNGNWFMAMRDALYPTPLGSYVYTAAQTNGMMGALAPVPAYASGGYVGGRGGYSGPLGGSTYVIHNHINAPVYGIDDLEAKIGGAIAREMVVIKRDRDRALGVNR